MLPEEENDFSSNFIFDPTLVKKTLTVNDFFEKIIIYCESKKGKSYQRIRKILESHDKNRNYQSNILRDLMEILIEMSKLI